MVGMFGSSFGFAPGLGSSEIARPGDPGYGYPRQRSLAEIAAEEEEYLKTPRGIEYQKVKESEAAYARKQADAKMQNEKRQLDATVANLRRQGRTAEAEMVLKRGEAKLARERFAWEREIKAVELGMAQERLGMDRSRLGLDTAEAAAKFQQGPDMMFAGADFGAALNRASAGLGPTPYGAGGTPTPRTYQDFMSAQTPQGAAQQASAGANAANAQVSSGAGTPAVGTDPRIQAATAVIKAIPPSEGGGVDDNDRAALNAVQSIFAASKPGTLARMRPGQRAAFGAGLSRLGYWAPDAIAEMTRSQPGQGAARRA